MRANTGHVLASVGGFRAVPPLASGQSRVDSLRLGIHSTGSSPTWTDIGTFPSLELYGHAVAGGDPGVIGSAFGTMLVTGASGDVFRIGNARTGAIRVVGASGRTERTIRLVHTPAPLSDAMVAARLRHALEIASSDAERERARAMYSRSRLPRSLPHFQRFIGGPDGEMWIELVNPIPDAPPRFLVTDARGRVVASVVLPRSVRVDQVGRDWIVGIVKDELGREQAVEYGLTRGAR